MKHDRQRVVIVSPTYNEKGNIRRLCEVLLGTIFPKVGAEYDPHILIVDDSSPDGTGEEVLRLAKDYPNLHLLTNKKKLGLGNAYSKGLSYAIDTLHADIVFQFDADFQHDPTRIPPMLKKLAEGYDIVLGARYIPGGSIPDTWGLYRKFLSVVGNFVIRVVITYFSIHDWTTGYRAIRKQVIEDILPEMNRDTFMGYTFQIGLLHKAVRRGYKVAEIPIHFVDRTYGKSKLGAEYIKNTLVYIFKVRIQEILSSRVFKFAVVGGIGTIVQLVFLQLLRRFLPYTLANLLAIEIAIISNFSWNNIWTFADRALAWSKIPSKFIQFNVASAGSVVIQIITALFCEKIVGLHHLFSVGSYSIDTGFVFALVGIGLGLLWNYTAYNRIVWKNK